MKLAQKIMNIRNDNNLTQEEFAQKLFVSRQTVSNWENGKCYPDMETLIMICDKFNISLDDLIKENKEIIKDIDKKIKSNKYKKIVIVIFIIIFMLITFYLGYKLFLLNYYDNGYSNRIYKNYFDNLKEITVEKSNDLANYSFLDLNIYIPLAQYNKANNFYIGSQKVLSLHQYRSSFYEFSNTGEYYKNIDFAEAFNQIDINDPVDLIRYFEIFHDRTPNIFWSKSDIELTFLMKNYIISETDYGNHFYKRYYWYNDLNGIITETNYDYEIEIYHEDQTYLIIVDKNYYKKEHLEEILSSIYFE